MWLVGSSIVKRAFPAAKKYPGGSSLGQEAEVWWQGYSGLTLNRVQGKLKTLLKVEDPPDFLLLHVGGNDIGQTPIKIMKDILLRLLSFIRKAFRPTTRLIWSEILPRRLALENKGLLSASRRFNSFATKSVKQTSGFYLRHINLRTVDNVNYLLDGVHLSPAGNKLFLDNLSFGLHNFLQGIQPWFA